MVKYDVITVGSAIVDNFYYTNIPELHKKKGRYIAYPIGSKFLVNEIDVRTGGSATNTATSFARLGLKVGCLASLGNDENANIILSELKKEKIDFIGTKTNKRTGKAVILDSKEHDRTILIHYGANSELDFNKIDKDKLDTKWFYFGSMISKSFETQKKLMNFARMNRIRVAWNPSQYQAKMGKELHPLLPYVDLLVLNREEAALVLGYKKPKLIKRMIVELHKKGPRFVCVTDGKYGAYFSDGTNKLRVYTHPVKVVERTGAGDAFASSLLAGIIKFKDIHKALSIALINSESVIKLRGAKNKLLTMKEMNGMLEVTRVDIKKI
ncbi:MAG: carbohydrate kinase family protein [Candidatus Woesearchaeota archaeon]|nr:MAG: carbohydrate kinase family protein [Candidatus Woesearchaeota archaeon]